MRATTLRRLVGVMILLVSLAILIWSLWPFGAAVRTVPVLPEDMQLPTPTGLLIGWILV